MKKMFSMVLVLVMVLSIVGCSNSTDKKTDEPSVNTESKADETKKEDSTDSKENTEETDVATDNEDSESVKITFLNTKGEIQAQLEESALVFQNETGIEVEIVPTGAGSSPFEKMTTLYNSGNAPTISMLDIGDLPKFEDVMLDLSNEKWIGDAMSGSLGIATLNDKVLAFPFAVEGYGLIYNKAAIESATGEAFDPTSITSRDDLQALFDKIKAGGTAPIIISPLDWSLAAHYMSIPFAEKGKDVKGVVALQDSIIDGSLKLADFTELNAAMDTFDMLASYNKDVDDPLSGTYDDGAVAIATGEAAFWFMGNWAWPQIDEASGDNKDFGFIPVPLDVAGESNKINAGPTKYVSVDKSQSSPEQQEAALKFLDWLVYEESGQNALVNTCSVIPAFTNIDKSPSDPLAKSVLEYVANDLVSPMVYTFPSDHWAEVGAFFQEYLAGFSTREEFYSKVEGYWAKQQ